LAVGYTLPLALRNNPPLTVRQLQHANGETSDLAWLLATTHREMLPYTNYGSIS
jgi:hypothetical protein